MREALHSLVCLFFLGFVYQFLVCSVCGHLTEPFYLGLSDRKAPAAPFRRAQEVLADTQANPLVSQVGNSRQNQGLSSGSSATHGQRGSQLPRLCLHHSLAPETNNRVICEGGKICDSPATGGELAGNDLV